MCPFVAETATSTGQAAVDAVHDRYRTEAATMEQRYRDEIAILERRLTDDVARVSQEGRELCDRIEQHARTEISALQTRNHQLQALVAQLRDECARAQTALAAAHADLRVMENAADRSDGSGDV